MKPTRFPWGDFRLGTGLDCARKRLRRQAAWTLVFALALWASGLPLRAADPLSGMPSGIGFSYLSGPTDAPYLGSEEGDFVITPTQGDWRQSLIYGNPGSSIYVGPIRAPTNSVLHVTDRLGRFSLVSLDYSSNNGPSTYDIQGWLGPNQQFHDTGTLAPSFFPFTFNTIFSPYSLFEVDGLYIQIIPGSGTTSINIDNLNVVTIPEPGSLAFLTLGSLAVARWRRSRRLG
jgi:hypothetical protein